MGRTIAGILLALVTFPACAQEAEQPAERWRMSVTISQVDELSTLVQVEVIAPDGSPVPNARVTVTAGVGAPLSIDGRTSVAIRTNGEGRITAPVECLGTGIQYVEVETVAPGGVVFEFVSITCPTREAIDAVVEPGPSCRIETETASAVAGDHEWVGELNRIQVWVAPELRSAEHVTLSSVDHWVDISASGASQVSTEATTTIDEFGYATFHTAAGVEGVYELEASLFNVPCDQTELVFLQPTCSFEFPNGTEGPTVEFNLCFHDVGDHDLSGARASAVADQTPIPLVLDGSGCARSWFTVRDGEPGQVVGRWAEDDVCRADVAVPNRPTVIEVNCPESVTEGCAVTCDVVAWGKDGVRARWPESIYWEVEGGPVEATYESARLSLELAQLVDRAPGVSEVPTSVGNPSDALATVLVSVAGADEPLNDRDSDGVLDSFDSFLDDPGPFLDANDDGVPQPEEERDGFRGFNGTRDTRVTRSGSEQIAVFLAPAEGSAPGYPSDQLTHFRVGSEVVQIGETVVFDRLADPTNHRTVTLFVFDENGTAPAGATATWTGCGLSGRRSGQFSPTVRIRSNQAAVGAQTLREETSTIFEPTGISTGIDVVESCTLSVSVTHPVCGETWEFDFDYIVPEE